MVYLILFHPHPASPIKGEVSIASRPWWEGLREGVIWRLPLFGL